MKIKTISIIIAIIGWIGLAFANPPGTYNSNLFIIPIQTLIPGSTGTIITDGASWQNIVAGGSVGAFSAGNLTNQTSANSSACNNNSACPAGTRYIGKKWLSPRIIVQVDYYGPNDNGLLYGGGGTGTVHFDGSNDASCSASWVSLDSFTTSGANSQHITRTSANITTTTAYLCHRASTTQSGSVGSPIAAFQMQDFE